MGIAIFLGVLSLLLTLQALADWWFDLPWMARAVFLLADFAVLGTLFRQRIHAPLSRRLGLAETALMVEKKWRHLRQSVISAVQLAEGRAASSRGSPELLEILFQQARARTTGLDFRLVIPSRDLRVWGWAGATALAVAVAAAAFGWPGSIALVERIFLLPVPRPTQTIVVDLTQDLAVPIGSDVEVAAKATGVIPTRGRVVLTYKDAPRQEYPVFPTPDHPDVFRFTEHNVQKDFTYLFYLNDGHGSNFSVTARVNPTLTDIACIEVYPDYTHLPQQPIPPTGLSLLVGSHLKIEATASTALKNATILLQGTGTSVPATLDAGGTHLTADVAIPAKGLTGLSLHLVDSAGVASADETVYPVDLVQDHPPTVKWIEPDEERETITLHAKPHIVFEADDDYGLVKLTLNFQLIPPPVGGADAPPVPVKSITFPVKSADQGRRYEYDLDPASQSPGWQTGWTVNYWVEAVDNNTATGPGVTRSEHKQFGILSPEEKMAELLAAQKTEADKIDKLSQTQEEISKHVQDVIPQNNSAPVK